MKFLLIHPKREDDLFEDIKLPPLGLAYLAAVLNRAGHEARILDANVEKDAFQAIRTRIMDFRPAVVGISVVSQLFRTSMKIAAMAKEADPGVTVILGGSHPTIFPEAVAAERNVDYVVYGEGEDTIVELAAALERGGAVDGIRGIARRDGGRVIVNPPRPLIRDLDRLPFPAYDLLPVGRYVPPQASRPPFMGMITSRGCAYRCVFCDARVVMGGKYRFHSPERTLAEIKYLVSIFGVREIMFKDSEFVQHRARTERLCDLLAEADLPVRWICNGRVGKTDLELMKKMKRAGCELIMFGVESGDQDVLNRLKKGFVLEAVRKTFRQAAEAGLKTSANFLIGNPGESADSVRQSIQLAREIRTDFAYFEYLFPYPGTELYRTALAEGWIPDDFDPSAVPVFRAPMNATLMDAGMLPRLMRRAYRSFYFRPRFIAGRIGTLNPVIWKNNIRGVLRILRLGKRV
jgi:anaerobic magnesium-protoporphyrin IX monomethyl ester cyclase